MAKRPATKKASDSAVIADVPNEPQGGVLDPPVDDQGNLIPSAEPGNPTGVDRSKITDHDILSMGAIAADPAVDASSIPAEKVPAVADGPSTVEIGGRTYAVTPELAAALESNPAPVAGPHVPSAAPAPSADVAALTNALTGLAGRLDAMDRTRVADPASQIDYAAEDAKFWESPTQAMNAYAADMGAQLEERIVNRVSAQTNARSSEDTFWSDFYTANPDLKEFDTYVKATAQGNLAHLKTVPTHLLAAEIAGLSRGSLLKAVERFGSAKLGDVPNRAVVEGGGAIQPSKTPGGSGSVAPNQASEQIVSISDILKQRARDKRMAS